MTPLLCRWALVLAALLASGPRLWAASAAESRAYTGATNLFGLGFYGPAEEALGRFAQTYSNSTHVAQAILYQAQARIALTNYAPAIALLTAHQAAAGTNADQYLFWLAEARYRQGDYPAARDGFARLVSEFPASTRRLEAAVGEASARMKLRDWPGAIQVLQRPDGAFQSATRAQGTNDLVARGYLLLAEACLAQKDYPAAKAALQPLATGKLAPATAWQRQYLACLLDDASGRKAQALEGTTNLLTLATNAAQPGFLARSVSLQAGLLEKAGHTNDAIAAFQKNLAGGVPDDLQRQALQKITTLCLADGRTTEAAKALQSFVDQYPNAASADLALLTLGEIRLRHWLTSNETNAVSLAGTNAPVATNSLDLALKSLQTLTALTNSPLLGKACLDLGWCFWLTTNLPASQTNFQAAFERLPFSFDQATACFKLADCYFRQTNYTAAITNYQAVVTRFAGLAEAQKHLVEPALYQTVQAGVLGGQIAAATNALARLLASWPGSDRTEAALLVAGLEITRAGNPEAARQTFLAFTRAAPNDPLRPAVELAIAQTYEQQDQWTNALQQYNAWLLIHTNSEFRPQAAFLRAQAVYRLGDETNALACFTNLVAEFPTNSLTQLAQMWAGTYYYNRGAFVDAEKSFRWIFQTNWPASDLTYQAQMMAGRAAFARQAWSEARGYFTGLYNTLACPEDLRIQALLAYAGCLVSQDSTNKAADYQQAIESCKRVCSLYPTNRLAPLAWGEMANALLQYAKSPQQYDDVTNAFQQVILSTNADAAARSMAKVGLSIALEKQADLATGTNQTALLSAALTNCLDVFIGTNLRDGEEAALFWKKEAGLEAGRLAERLQLWAQATKVYQQLKELVPALGPRLDANIRRCEEKGR
ncbi:MAG TPA: tetratricopeptide repeat protein [Candidatus Acidoferrum sp.]|nr:tetratricopeptide repeat protein [Candidatus Acidoferrum sp.]